MASGDPGYRPELAVHVFSLSGEVGSADDRLDNSGEGPELPAEYRDRGSG